MTRPKGGRISLTAFEADWLATILGTINPIELDALAHTQTTPPASVTSDPSGAWQRLVEKIWAVAPSSEPAQ